MQWTSFDADMLSKAETVMHVTLDPRGNFYLNQAAMTKLGEPVAVKVLFHKEARLIGIMAVPLKSKGAIELRAKYGSDVPARTFRAREFCLHLGILPDRTILFPDPKIEDGVLVLNFNTTIFAPRRAVSLSRTTRYIPPEPVNERVEG